jgi:protein-S-isoprenylcysteine O-methyltransferase Ste14
MPLRRGASMMTMGPAGGGVAMIESFLDSIHRVFNSHALRWALVRLRVPLVIAAVALLAMRVRCEWLIPGIAVSFVGELLQLWCFASLKKQKVLAARGPYAVVRNPMYLARYLLVAGFVLMLGSWWVLLVFTALYYFYMFNRVRREEDLLAGVFGADYERYRAAVPRFVPTPRPFQGNTLWTWDWKLFADNHGHWNLLAALLLYAVVWGACRLRG